MKLHRSRLVLALTFTVLSVSGIAAGLTETAIPPGAPKDNPAAYSFAVAKVLISEGSYQEALQALEEAARQEPRNAYVAIEQARLLSRLSDLSRSPRARADYLAQAATAARRARELAPENLDALRVVGEILLRTTPQDPSALAQAQEVYEKIRQRAPGDEEALTILGRIHLDREQPDKAADVFRELVRNTPNNRTAYSLLVESLLQANRPKEAEEVLQEILAGNPASLESRLNLAQLQSQRGDQAAALATLRAAPEGQGQDPQVRRQLAATLYRKGDLAAAQEIADSLLQTQPDNLYVAVLKGLILAAQGQNSEAIGLLSKLHDKDPGNPVVSETLARVLQREGRGAEAGEILNRLAADLERDGNAREARAARFEAAQVFLAMKDWTRASEALAPLLRSGEAEVRDEARNLQVEVLVAQKQYPPALELLAGEADKTSVLASRYAEVLFRSGEERQGKRQLARLAAASDPTVFLAAIQAYHRLEQYEPSIEPLRRFAAANPKLPAIRFLLGAAYERTGRHTEAEAAFREALRLDANFHAALNYLGYMWAEAGRNLGEAKTLLERAVALEPDNGSYVDSLGWAHFQAGELDPARVYLERAARLTPDDSTVHEHLGDIYRALGRADQARSQYERSLALGSDKDQELRRKLEGLGSARP